MDGLFFLIGIVIAVIAIIIIVFQIKKAIRRGVQRFRSSAVGQVVSAINEVNRSGGSGNSFAIGRGQALVEEEGPRSLSGCDTLLLPKITKDFPDFDPTQAENIIRDTVVKHLQGKANVKIYNIVIARYEAAGVQKTIIYQAAASYSKSGTTVQKRYDVHYAYRVKNQNGESVAANCPNCGGVLVVGETECSFCGSRVYNALDQAWSVEQILES